MSLVRTLTRASRDLAFFKGKVWQSRDWPLTALAVLAVVMATVLPYVQTVPGYFLGDDFGLIWAFYDHEPLHFVSLFARSWDAGVYGDVPDEIRPLVALSYQLDFALGAGQPFAFHLSNIAFHAVNALLVMGLARVAARLPWTAAAFGGALFAVMPTHAETVAWISGRADSIPAMFYLGTLLSFAAWRRYGAACAYAAALMCCMLALFSKQNAITLPAILIAYDLIVERHPPRPTWRYVAPYVPFVGTTALYLGLRYALFGNLMRENVMAPSALAAALIETIANQFEILLFGYFALEDLPANVRVALRSVIALTVALALVPAISIHRRVSRLVFFGPLWWLVNVAPLAVTYATPRHLYLPAAGLAVAAGILLAAIPIRCRPLVAVAALGGFTIGLLGPVGEWTASASISEKMAREMYAEAQSAPSGSLILLGAPRTAYLSPPSVSARVLHDISPTPGQPWLWSFAVPYVHGSPFVMDDTNDRVRLVAPLLVDCCGPQHWFDRSIVNIESWAFEPDPVPLVVLVWHPSTGDVRRYSDADTPCLRDRLLPLASTWSPELLDRGLSTLLQDVADRQPCGA